MTASPVVLVMTAAALPVARRIEMALPGASLQALAGRLPEADTQFSDTLDHVRGLFSARVPIIALCPAELLIRAIAPLLRPGTKASPVVAVSEDGTCVVPLVGAAFGGNALAQHLAAVLGGSAAVTAPGNPALALALNQPPAGWCLANPQDAAPIMAEIFAGAPVRIEGDAPWLLAMDLPFDEAADITLCATTAALAGSPTCLVYHPRRVVMGAGCSRACTAEEMTALAKAALHEADIAAGTLAAIASLDRKAGAPALLALARHFGVPLRVFSAEALERETPRLVNPSDVVFAETGCHGISEGAALAGCGTHGMLILEKRKSDRATVALAAAPGPLDADSIGRAPDN